MQGIEALNLATPGTDQEQLGVKLDQSISLSNELRTDHGTFKTAVDANEARISMLQTQLLAGEVIPTVLTAGLTVDGVNAENAETGQAILIRFNGQIYKVAAIAELDISALAAGGATITQNKAGVAWVFANTAGSGDVEVDKDAADYDTAIEAWAQYSVPTNTLPPGADDVPIGAILITENNSGPYTWGTDSLTAESATYTDFFGQPGVETVIASFVLDAAAATFTYGAGVLRLGDGTRIVPTGKANVTIAGSNVADGAVGAWLFYVLADDVEIAVQLGAAYADLATAQAAVRDHTPNPYLALAGVFYAENESGGAFIPGTTNLDATGITMTFTEIGPGANQLEIGRDALNQPHSALTNGAPATITAGGVDVLST